MTTVETSRVGVLKPFQDIGPIRFRGSRSRMIVMGHQHESMDLPLGSRTDFTEGLEKHHTVRWVLENRVPSVSPTHHKINRLRIRHSWSSWHECLKRNLEVMSEIETRPPAKRTVHSGHRRRGAQSVGGLGATSNTAHAGADWLELGTGVRLDLENQWNVSVDDTGQFGRNNVSAHFVGARVGYEW